MKTTALKTMSADIESAVKRATKRLQTSKETCERETRERGRRAGVEWAADRASFRELERLAMAEVNFYLCDHRGPPALFINVVFGRDSWELQDFWETCLGLDPTDEDDMYSADWWDAFTEGAVEVFAEADV